MDRHAAERQAAERQTGRQAYLPTFLPTCLPAYLPTLGAIIGGVRYASTPNILAQYAITSEKVSIAHYANAVHYVITPPKIGHYVITPEKNIDFPHYARV